MSLNQEIEQLLKQLELIKEQQRNCNHEWNNPVYDPEKTEIVKYSNRYAVDNNKYYPEEIHTGEYELRDRWSRTCTKCGYREYTKDLNDFEVQEKTKLTR